MMNVIIGEGLVDNDYVEHTPSATAARRPCRSSTRRSGPSRCDRHPAEDIGTLAGVRHRPTVDDPHRRGDRAHAGGGRRVPARSLPAGPRRCLAPVGGGLLQLPSGRSRSTGARARSPQDRPAPYGQPVAARRALAGELGLGPPIKALFVYNSNPAHAGRSRP